MNLNDKALLIDAGNTNMKVSLAENGLLTKTERFSMDDQSIGKLAALYPKTQKVMSSVLSEKQTAHLAEQMSPCMVITAQTPLPLEIYYLTPNTLGIDRICNACGMLRLKKTHVSISIDIGTCIKFDVLEGNKYIGGSISPGIELRYRSLNEFTGKLPLLNFRSRALLSGQTSEQSMHSGVMNGIATEIEGFMALYRQQYGELTFFLTGGDAGYFDFAGKNDIFVAENLTLEGLYSIYAFNAR
jgi:type III pantothenate kinase